MHKKSILFMGCLCFKYYERMDFIMKSVYITKGTCSSSIEIEVDDGIVKSVEFTGGCNGNLQGISRMVTGMKVSDVIERLEGIRCGNKPTSCPDQLTNALKAMLEK